MTTESTVRNSLSQSGYRRWDGQPRSAWWACWTLVRVALAQIFRRWLFWLLIGLGLMNFLFHFVLVYLKATIAVQNADFARMMDGFRVTGSGDAYADFMNAQAGITALLLAFAGSTVIGSDYRQGGMIFYLSRSIGNAQYIVGKLLAVAAVVVVITLLPAIVLYAEYGLLSSSLEYFRENWRILAGILGYGAVLAGVQSVLVFAVAAWVPRTVPLVMTWLGMFTLMTALAHAMREVWDDRNWLLLALWEDMFRVGRWCFGGYPEGRLPSPENSALVLAVLSAACVLLIVRRVRAVEVVK